MTDSATAFIEFALTGQLDAAREILRMEPRLTEQDLFAAAVYGDADSVTVMPGSVNRAGGPRQWPPLLYLCYSGFQRFDLDRRKAFLACARRLLDAGADPNAFFPVGENADSRQTALFGVCGRANNPELTRLLLAAGADANEGVPGLGPEALYHAAELPDTACLEAMLAADPYPDKVSYCLARKLDFDDPAGVRLFLAHGADPDFVSPFGDRMTRLHHAVQRGRNADIVRLLLDAGANIAAQTATAKTPYALAVRYGRTDVAALLHHAGATDAELTAMDILVGACAANDEAAVAAIHAKNPGLADSIGAAENSVFGVLAAENRAPALHLMMSSGFHIDARGEFGPVLHHASWTGAADAVAALLEYGPDLEEKNNFGGTALDTALYGARHCHDVNGGSIASGRPQDVRHGDYMRVVRLLLDAGANANAPGLYPTGDPALDALLEPFLK